MDCKARLVARGFEDDKNMETDAPPLIHRRHLISGWMVKSFDVERKGKQPFRDNAESLYVVEISYLFLKIFT